MTDWQLIRARLKPSPSLAALGPLLLPEDTSQRVMASHRLVWSLFAGDPDAKRGFLWREERPGHFLILAREAPGASEVFDVDAPKSFAPMLQAGDRLRFMLRANATKAVKTGLGGKSKRADVVMAALHAIPGARREDRNTLRSERAVKRPELIVEAGREWLERQGKTYGFSLPSPPAVDGYTRLQIPRPLGKPIEIGTLDFTGVLEVTDPALFLPALLQGFGHAKAFGCGLMLIRRA